MPDFDFVEVTPGTIELGWRFDSVISDAAVEAMAEYGFGHDSRQMFFSPRRIATIARFQIATTALDWNEFEFPNNPVEADNVPDVCVLMNRELSQHGWRLPTEDEFEAAVGGELFFWGNEIPDGRPGKTSFTRHLERTPKETEY